MSDTPITEEVMPEEVAAEDSFLDMSDDELSNMTLDDFEASEGEASDEGELALEAEESEAEEEADAEDEEEVAEGETPEDAETPDSEVDEEESSEEEPSDEEAEAEETSPEVDYETEYKKLMAPFKANGKMISVDNTDDIINLMSMGANYNKKMAALKPNLKLLKMLENNSLLSEEKLSFLIDLDKKEPGAVQKLIKDANIDPLELDLNEETDYQPNSYTVNDNQIELDSVLDSLKESPKYSETLDVVSNKWDESSRKIIVNNPQIISVINAHMQNGIYEQVTQEVEKRRVLGRLNGLSDLEAYRQVGDEIYANGAPQSAPATEPPKVKKPKADPKVTSRKRAAGATKSSPVSTKTTEDFNPLSMSDDEIEKLVANKFL